MNSVDEVQLIAAAVGREYLEALKFASEARDKLRGLLNGKFITFRACIETYPTKIYGACFGQVEQVYIERKRVVISCRVKDREGKWRSYSHEALPRDILSIGETENYLQDQVGQNGN